MAHNHDEMFKQLQERITELEERIINIERDTRPSNEVMTKLVTFEQYKKYSSNSEEAFLQEAIHQPFPEVVALR